MQKGKQAEIVQFLRLRPGKTYTSAMIANRFGVTKTYANACLRQAAKQMPMKKEMIGGETYYTPQAAR